MVDSAEKFEKKERISEITLMMSSGLSAYVDMGTGWSNKSCCQVALWELQDAVFWAVDPYTIDKSQDISAFAASIFTILF